MSEALKIIIIYTVMLFYLTELFCKKIERLEKEIEEIKRNIRKVEDD